MTLLIIGVAIIWYSIGVMGFVYWWTKDADLTVDIFIFPGMFAGLVGPIAWAIGWTIHGSGKDAILFRKR